MVRLKSEPRAVFGEKLLDLGNLAAAALVFSRFVERQPLSWTIMLAGVAIWFGIASIALWLMGAWQWKPASAS